MHVLRIFYRNREGKDTKIVNWTRDLTQQPLEFQSYIDIELDENDLSYQAANHCGVYLKKIVNGQIVDRDIADIDKDKNNAEHIIDQAEKDIIALLQGRQRVTWLMIGAYNCFLYLRSLQAVMNIEDSSLSVEGQEAKSLLNWMEANIVGPSNAIMTQRDTDLAALDQED